MARINRYVWDRADVEIASNGHRAAAAADLAVFAAPHQPRDRRGRWTDGHGGDGGAGHPDLTRSLVTEIGLDPDTARRVQATTDRLADRYGPEIRRAEYMPAKGPDGKDMSQAVAAMDDRGVLYVNPFKLNDQVAARAVSTGHGAHGDETLEGIITHEYGHRIIQGPDQSRRAVPANTAAWETAYKSGYTGTPKQIKQDLSSYALTNQAEQEAEMFSNYLRGGSHRAPWVKAWGDTFDREFGARTDVRVAAAGPPADEGEPRWMTPGFIIPDTDQPEPPANRAATATESFEAPGQPRDRRGRWAPTGKPLAQATPGGKTPGDAAEVEANYQGVLDRARKDGTLTEAKDWYADQHDAIGTWAATKDVDPQTFAAMVAATSPRMMWETKTGRKVNLEAAAKAVDVARAYPHLSGDEAARTVASPGMLRNSLANAVDIYHGAPADTVLRGPKVRNFYNNLTYVNSTPGVTIDTHLVRAAVGDPHLGDKEVAKYTTGAAYNWTADRVRHVASRNGLSPAEAQAAIWTEWIEEAA